MLAGRPLSHQHRSNINSTVLNHLHQVTSVSRTSPLPSASLKHQHHLHQVTSVSRTSPLPSASLKHQHHLHQVTSVSRTSPLPSASLKHQHHLHQVTSVSRTSPLPSASLKHQHHLHQITSVSRMSTLPSASQNADTECYVSHLSGTCSHAMPPLPSLKLYFPLLCTELFHLGPKLKHLFQDYPENPRGAPQ